MRKNCLNELVLLNIHNNINVKSEDIIVLFAKYTNSRHLQLRIIILLFL